MISHYLTCQPDHQSFTLILARCQRVTCNALHCIMGRHLPTPKNSDGLKCEKTIVTSFYCISNCTEFIKSWPLDIRVRCVSRLQCTYQSLFRFNLLVLVRARHGKIIFTGNYWFDKNRILLVLENDAKTIREMNAQLVRIFYVQSPCRLKYLASIATNRAYLKIVS